MRSTCIELVKNKYSDYVDHFTCTQRKTTRKYNFTLTLYLEAKANNDLVKETET